MKVSVHRLIFLCIISVCLVCAMSVSAGALELSEDFFFDADNEASFIDDLVASVTFTRRTDVKTGETPQLDSDETIRKLNLIYGGKVTSVTVLSVGKYPSTEPGAHEISLSNSSAIVEYEDPDGCSQVVYLSLVGRSAVAYIDSVQKTRIEITVDPCYVIYGDEPDFTFRNTALPDGISIDSSAAVYSVSGAGDKLDVGTYDVSLSGLSLTGAGKDGCEIVYIDGTLTVKPRRIALFLSDASVVFGEPAPTFFVNTTDELAYSDTLETVLSDYEFTSDYEPGSPCRDLGYEIGLDVYGISENYVIGEIKSGTLTVEKRTLYIIPSRLSKLEGEIDPEYTYIYSGAFATDVPEFLGKLGRASGESVGTYAYSLGSLELLNAAPFYSSNYTLALDPDAPVFEIKQKPFALRISSVTLALSDRVHIAYRLETGSLFSGSAEQMGILQWSAEEYEAANGYEYLGNEDFALIGTDMSEPVRGRDILPTEYMTVFYAVAYIRTENGYFYSEPVRYSVTEYAEYAFANDGYEAVRPLLTALLDYGTAIMNYCGIEAVSYPNDIIDDTERVGAEYSDSLASAPINAANAAKNDAVSLTDDAIAVPFAYSQSYRLALDGGLILGIGIKAPAADGEAKLHYVKRSELDGALDTGGRLDPEKMTAVAARKENGGYTASIDGISPDRADELYYTVFSFENSSGDIMYTEPKLCSASLYAAQAVSAFDGAAADAARAVLVYMNEAKLIAEELRS